MSVKKKYDHSINPVESRLSGNEHIDPRWNGHLTPPASADDAQSRVPVRTAPTVVTPPRVFQRILLPVDGSASSSVVAEWGIRFARLFGATATVMMAVSTEDSFLGGAKAMATARQTLADLEEKADEQGVKVTTMLRNGDPVAEILEMAKSIQSDLIIMASHSRGAIASLFLGSVSRGVLQQSPCLVMIYGEHVQIPVPTLERPLARPAGRSTPTRRAPAAPPKPGTR